MKKRKLKKRVKRLERRLLQLETTINEMELQQSNEPTGFRACKQT